MQEMSSIAVIFEFITFHSLFLSLLSASCYPLRRDSHKGNKHLAFLAGNLSPRILRAVSTNGRKKSIMKVSSGVKCVSFVQKLSCIFTLPLLNKVLFHIEILCNVCCIVLEGSKQDFPISILSLIFPLKFLNEARFP